eukprot:m.235872 g.235872  ORF g.235872 m.235872 type:complete len:424 (+) comp12897_c0_seq1:299-1570(+)
MADQPVAPPRRHRKRDTAEVSQYALYAYRANRPKGEEKDKEGAADTSAEVAEFLAKEATSNDDFSLSVIKTNISGEGEPDLRSALVRRLARGCIYSGSGNIFVLDDKATPASTSALPTTANLCYYCLVRADSEDTSEGDDTPSTSEFVICLLRTFESADVELDLFRNEMDALCDQIASGGLLRAPESADSQTALDSQLGAWYDTTVEYLPRCCDLFAEHLDVLLYATAVGRKVEPVSGSARQKADLSSFVHALSLSSLLNVPGVVHSGAQSFLPPLQIAFDEHGGYTIAGSLDASSFCKTWAKAMAPTLGAFALKQVIHAHELKIIQEINTMKRLVCQAAGSHYALYNTYRFVCTCETVPSLVISSALATASAEDGANNTKQVLAVLLDFIRTRTDTTGLPAHAQAQLAEAMNYVSHAAVSQA